MILSHGFHFTYSCYSGIDGGLVLATTIKELNNTVQQLCHDVHDLKESMVSGFLLLNESVTNLARKIPSPVPSPTQPGTNASIHGDKQAPIPVSL